MNRALLLLALLAAGCGDASSPTSRPAQAPAGRAALLKHVASADAWRIERASDSYDYFKYKETSGPVSVSDPLRELLTEHLLDPGIVGDGLHPCVPTPGVKVRFNRPNAPPVWVFFCFECHELFIYDGSLRYEHKGFDGGVTPLIRVMQRIFTDDKVIQSLK